VDSEFADLIPLFVEESRDRVERLATVTPRLLADREARIEAKRELHTLKGAGRMMRLGTFAELCHAAEELLQGSADGSLEPAVVPLFLRVADRLSAMLEVIAEGGEPPEDTELQALLAAASGSLAAPPPTARRTGPGPDLESDEETGREEETDGDDLGEASGLAAPPRGAEEP
jgi:chemosensory pili system protein ChpA (sensor histidine kinase/response regulator)